MYITLDPEVVKAVLRGWGFVITVLSCILMVYHLGNAVPSDDGNWKPTACQKLYYMSVALLAAFVMATTIAVLLSTWKW